MPIAISCREVQQRWDRRRKDLTRRACAWEAEGMKAYQWTLVMPTYDERPSTPNAARMSLPRSVVVVVANRVIRTWEVAPHQQCQDYRAVDAVPTPGGGETHGSV